MDCKRNVARSLGVANPVTPDVRQATTTSNAVNFIIVIKESEANFLVDAVVLMKSPVFFVVMQPVC